MDHRLSEGNSSQLLLQQQQSYAQWTSRQRDWQLDLQDPSVLSHITSTAAPDGLPAYELSARPWELKILDVEAPGQERKIQKNGDSTDPSSKILHYPPTETDAGAVTGYLALRRVQNRTHAECLWQQGQEALLIGDFETARSCFQRGLETLCGGGGPDDDHRNYPSTFYSKLEHALQSLPPAPPPPAAAATKPTSKSVEGAAEEEAEKALQSTRLQRQSESNLVAAKSGRSAQVLRDAVLERAMMRGDDGDSKKPAAGSDRGILGGGDEMYPLLLSSPSNGEDDGDEEDRRRQRKQKRRKKDTRRKRKHKRRRSREEESDGSSSSYHYSAKERRRRKKLRRRDRDEDLDGKKDGANDEAICAPGDDSVEVHGEDRHLQLDDGSANRKQSPSHSFDEESGSTAPPQKRSRRRKKRKHREKRDRLNGDDSTVDSLKVGRQQRKQSDNSLDDVSGSVSSGASRRDRRKRRRKKEKRRENGDRLDSDDQTADSLDANRQQRTHSRPR